MTTARLPTDKLPRDCFDCRRQGFWRYRGRHRWHCIACAPCPDPDDAIFAFNGVEIAPVKAEVE